MKLLPQPRPAPVQIPKGKLGRKQPPDGWIQLELADRVPRITAGRALIPPPLFNLG